MEINTTKNVKDMTAEQCLAEMFCIMIRSGHRTNDGFECVFMHPTYSTRYQVFLPYINLTISGLCYRRVGVDDVWHDIGLATAAFARSLVTMLRRNLYARADALNGNVHVPSIAARVIEYLAAGYSMKETQEKLGITERACRTARQNILNATGARSISQAVAHYILWQNNPDTFEATYNPY